MISDPDDPAMILMLKMQQWWQLVSLACTDGGLLWYFTVMASRDAFLESVISNYRWVRVEQLTNSKSLEKLPEFSGLKQPGVRFPGYAAFTWMGGNAHLNSVGDQTSELRSTSNTGLALLGQEPQCGSLSGWMQSDCRVNQRGFAISKTLARL